MLDLFFICLRYPLVLNSFFLFRTSSSSGLEETSSEVPPAPECSSVPLSEGGIDQAPAPEQGETTQLEVSPEAPKEDEAPVRDSAPPKIPAKVGTSGSNDVAGSTRPSVQTSKYPDAFLLVFDFPFSFWCFDKPSSRSLS